MKKRHKDIVQDPSEEPLERNDEPVERIAAGLPGPSAIDGGRAEPEDRTESEPELSPEQSVAERERDEYRDLLLRKTAEFENFRKRTERERQTQAETAAFNIIQELLPLVDDLERALNAEPGSEGADAYRQGVELIHRQLLDILRRRGVKPVEALGAVFDPHYHQAVSYEPAGDKTDGEIVEEFRRGYMLGDRLLRPSMVKVAKG